MNSVQLDTFLKHLPQFGGVFAADNIKIKHIPCYIIVNTDTQNLSGQHWICMKLSKDQCEFFDSLGKSPYNYHKSWHDLLITTAGSYLFNDQRLQNYSSSTCGQYCVYYILKSIHGYDFEDIIDGFDALNLKKNDASVLHFVHNYINSTHLT